MIFKYFCRWNFLIFSVSIQRDCLEYFKEKDHYKDKLNIVQQEKEHLEQETRTLTTVIDQLRGKLYKNRVKLNQLR
jgi:predicted  nucleic acid-binding Zn-ribbon protein